MRPLSEWREEFILAMHLEGVPIETSRAVMRDATTIQRLAVAACNGDWPCDDGERPVTPCAKCGNRYHASTLRKGGLCPDCRAQARIRTILAPFHVTPIFGGDPRGCCVKLRVPSGRTDDGGNEGLCVPSGH